MLVAAILALPVSWLLQRWTKWPRWAAYLVALVVVYLAFIALDYFMSNY